MKKEIYKEQSLGSKIVLSSLSLFLLVTGIFSTVVGTVDQVWEHTLGLCMAFSSIFVFDLIKDKKQFAKDIKSLFL